MDIRYFQHDLCVDSRYLMASGFEEPFCRHLIVKMIWLDFK
jgi:hypothetical protein